MPVFVKTNKSLNENKRNSIILLFKNYFMLELQVTLYPE